MWCQKRREYQETKLFRRKAKVQAKRVRLFRQIFDEEVGLVKNELVSVVPGPGCYTSNLLRCGGFHGARDAGGYQCHEVGIVLLVMICLLPTLRSAGRLRTVRHHTISQRPSRCLRVSVLCLTRSRKEKRPLGHQFDLVVNWLVLQSFVVRIEFVSLCYGIVVCFLRPERYSPIEHYSPSAARSPSKRWHRHS